MSKEDKIFLSITLVLCIIFGAFFISCKKDQVKQLKVQKIDSSVTFRNSDVPLIYKIESMSKKADIYNISGWAIVKGIDTIDFEPSIILSDEENNYYKLKTRIAKRADIKENIDDGKNYDNSGINSEFYLEGLDINKSYKIGIQIKIGENEYFTWTDTKLNI